MSEALELEQKIRTLRLVLINLEQTFAQVPTAARLMYPQIISQVQGNLTVMRKTVEELEAINVDKK